MKKAIVIGATSGIGKELALTLIKNNYFVAITGRRKALLEEIHENHKENTLYKVHDVTDIETSEAILKDIVTALKTVDLIVFSSGVVEVNNLLEWEKDLPTLQTNVVGATKIYQLAYNFFRQQGYGHLVGISSVASLRGDRSTPAYFASKAFQANYLESLWMKGQTSSADIVVTDIRPGFVDTKMAFENSFGKASLEKATKQIFKAIQKKKKMVYVTKRWRIIAFFLQRMPAKLILKFK